MHEAGKKRDRVIIKKRKKELKNRRGYLVSLVITGSLWAIFLLILFFVDPEREFALLIFLSVLFFALLFTFSLLVGNTRRGIIIAATIVIFLFISSLGVGTLINLILLSMAALTFEIYFMRKLD